MDDYNNRDSLATVPKVSTLAKPSSDVLLAARREVQRNKAIQAAFLDAQKAKDSFPNIREELTEVVLDLLFSKLEGSEAAIREASRFLVDEYFQFGQEPLLVSNKTGLPVALIKPEDIWQPPPTFRENPDGSRRLVHQKPRLRPDLEGMLVLREVETEREGRLFTEISNRLTKGGLKPHSSSLAPITRDGRQKFVERLKEQLPDILPSQLKGIAAQFAHFFHFTAPANSETLTHYPDQTVQVRVRTPIVDHKARNYQFSQEAHIKALLGSHWMAEIAGFIVEKAVELEAYMDSDFIDPKPALMYFGGGPVLRTLWETQSKPCFIAPTSEVAAFKDSPICHLVPKEYDIKHRVVHDRWDIVGLMKFDLWVDWDFVFIPRFTNLPSIVHAGEVVQ